MYQALYRKWRPKTFDDVVGQEHITTTLKNEVAAMSPSHAYLFCGTRGTGKTSCSKILAKAVNCPNAKDGNPCCTCEICVGIDNDSILDVTEIDAASNSGVDNIRELREEANFSPAMTKYRVYIIDETHMLSVGAFNALLKIMEEPPAHVIFILATTEIHKVPATVLSRCQRFDFRRIPAQIIADRLGHIAAAEAVALEPDAALLIARLSDGGMRDALSLLDLCITGGDAVTVQTVEQCAGLVGQTHLFEIAQAAQSGDSAQALETLERLWGQGVDYQRLCEQLIGFFRGLMMVKAVRDASELVSGTVDELERYRTMAAGLSMGKILDCLDLMQEILAKMSRTSMRRTELEMGLLRLCELCARADKAETIQSGATSSAVSALEAKLARLEKAVASGQAASPQQKQPDAQTEPVAQGTPAPTAEEIAKTPVQLFDQWTEVLEALKTRNKALFGALASSRAFVGGELLLVDAGEGGMFTQMMRSDGYAKQSLKEAVQTVTGQKFRLGPYVAQKYKVEKKSHGLEDILMKASELGADVEVK